MSITSSALTWPAHDGAAAGEAVRAGTQAEWKLTRRCSVTPRQLSFGLGLVGLVSLAIGLSFWWLGAGAVLFFSGVEIAVIAAALCAHALHACDGDTVRLTQDALDVQSRRGSIQTSLSMSLESIRVLSPIDDRSPVRIEGPGRVVEVGSQVPHARRLAFASELRQAVRAARSAKSGGAQFWS